MTPISKMVVWKMAGPLDYCLRKDALDLMIRHKVEKLPLTLDDEIIGLISIRDLENDMKLDHPNKDIFGRLMVGAAVGVKEEDFDRAKKLVDGGVDVLVIDIANGHSDLCVNAV